MKIYAFSGLGADKRVFQFLNLKAQLIPVDWIAPKQNETIDNYAKRLFEAINPEEEFAILGVSFGGLIAMEISKIYKPKLTILISSAETKHELPPIYRLFGKSGVIKFIPKFLLRPPKKMTKWLFGAENSILLYQIIDDTDLTFAKWAIEKITTWKNEYRLERLYKIHGTNDKMIPIKPDSKTIAIPGGGHFMIVDRATELSTVINKLIEKNTQPCP
jgi:pimeloyl-ACP methyl ester carboxylesterase